MLTWTQALTALTADVAPLAPETVPLWQAGGRVVAEPVVARVTQPPAAVSAMDGYAVRHEDCTGDAMLEVIGEAPAGRPFEGRVDQGQAVRVFTGSVVPNGADHVVIQEDVQREGERITLSAPQPAPRNIRAAGIDFSEGAILIPAGTVLGPAQLAIAAAANLAEVSAFPRPRIAVLANGDELRLPGTRLGPGEIISSTPFALAGMIEDWGGVFVDLGIAADDPADIRARIRKGLQADIIIALGGASVGDHDHMQAAFAAEGLQPVFSKVKLKPGKPTWAGRLGGATVLGLPGNPASALVCAQLFLKPLVWKVTGRVAADSLCWRRARITEALEPPGGRETFLRGRAVFDDEGRLTCVPVSNQDSSLLSPFLTADLLIHRPAGAPRMEAGTLADCIAIG